MLYGLTHHTMGVEIEGRTGIGKRQEINTFEQFLAADSRVICRHEDKVRAMIRLWISRAPATRPLRRSRWKGPSDGGFSVLQLIVAMSISTTVAAIAQPTVSEVLREYDLRFVSRQLYAELQRARSLAVMGNSRVRIRVGTRNELWVERLNIDTNAWEPEVTGRDWAKATAGVTVGALAPVVFAANGSAPEAGLFWVSRNGSPPLFILVSSGGRIRFYS